MKPEAAELLAHYGNLEIRPGLRIREGGTTDAVEAEDLHVVLAGFAEFFRVAQNHDDEEREAMCDALRNLRTDRLGRDVVAY